MQHKSTEKGSLSLSAETAMWQQAQAGCRESMNLLMSQHDGLVHAIVTSTSSGRITLRRSATSRPNRLMASYLRVRPRTGDNFFHLRLAGHYADGLGCCQEMASNNDRVLAAGVTRRKSGTGPPMGEESDSGCDTAGDRPITGAVANRPARSLRVGRRKPGDFSPNWRTIGGQPAKSVSIASRTPHSSATACA